MPVTSPPAVPAAVSPETGTPAASLHRHAPHPAGRRVPVKLGASALRASIGARLAVAAVLCAVMWGAVAVVVHL